MGLAVLPHMAQILKCRQEAVSAYCEKLNPAFQILKSRDGSEWNYSYFPVLFANEEALLVAEQNLQANEILARRYFYPCLNTLQYTNSGRMPISEDISNRILCLPLYFGLVDFEINTVSSIINHFS